MKEKVGSLPDPGEINPGDPGHIAVHDEMAEIVQEAADAAGIILDPPAPPPAVVGQYGHVEAHNRLLANLEQLAEAGVIGGGTMGFATVTAVSGAVSQIPHTDADGNDWISFRFRDDGLISTSDGYLDVLVVGGGGGGSTNNASVRCGGGGGGVRWGLHMFTEVAGRQITVGKGGAGRNMGKAADGGVSRVAGVLHGGSGQGAYAAAGNVPAAGASGAGGGGGRGCDGYGGTYVGGGADSGQEGMVLNYENADIEYGRGGNGGQGGGGYENPSSANGVDGVVVIKVPAGNVADGVRIKVHGWNRYAKVTDGVVTEVAQQPDNEPRTLDAEWIDAPDNVQVGWVHDDGEYAPPPDDEIPTAELIAYHKAAIERLEGQSE